jgi:hypothetical protein
MSAISSYQHQPLEPGEIRLLQLLPPRPHVQNDPIRFHIVHASFAQCLVIDSFFSYEALSYVWGGIRTDPVYCDDREILVTPNLVSALTKLRETMPVYPGFHRTLWIDSICINQDDVVERGHQVRLMKEIYSHALKVIVWLGGSQEVERYLTSIKNGPYSQDLQHQVLERSYYAAWSVSVAGIFDQPWFQRVWVIQEVVFAAKPIVQGGNMTIEWELLVDAALAGSESSQITATQRRRCDAVLGIECLRNQIQEQCRSNAGPQRSECDQNF